MATTVGQHQQGAFSTPINGTTGDAAEVLSNDNTIADTYNDHDSDPGIHLQSSVLGSRPVAGSAGRKWLITNPGVLPVVPIVQYDNGSSWVNVGALPEAIPGGTFAGSYTFDGTGVKFGQSTTQDLWFNNATARGTVLPFADAGGLGDWILGSGSRRLAGVFSSVGLFGDTGGSIDASAALEIFSTTKALLLPRLDPASIVTPVNGMIVYNSLTDTFQGYAGGFWEDLH